jgi:YspA, cpYpsA-related SLOG family
MRVVVCGSRGWEDRTAIAARIGILPAKSTIVHGGAKGADEIAARAAVLFGHEVEPHFPDWNMYGKKAGYVRNRRMIETAPDLVLAFWDGDSPGTRQMIGLARRYSIPVEIIMEEA